MDQAVLRAWWSARQGLDGSMTGKSSAEVLARTGWARSVGGVGPYLTLQARCGVGRQAVDEAVAKCEIHELPSVRGCTYVVPASDFALALKLSQGFGDAADIAKAKKHCGFSDKELEKLCTGVVGVLGKGAKDPREIREELGDLVRNLGPEGKKLGLTTTLPIALGTLQSQGEIRRVPTNGRLDQQRYRYVAWKDNPLRKSKLTDEEAQHRMAERYFRWIGPATVANLQWHCALGMRVCKALVADLKLVPLAAGDDRMMFEDDREALAKFKPSAKPQFALVSGLDGIVLLRRDLAGVLDPEDANKKAYIDRDKKPMGGLSDLPSHGIFDRGQLIGLWEFDSVKQEVVWATFNKAPPGLKKEIDRVQQFVRDDLGDARSFSLDSPESRVPRIEALRAGF